MSLRLLLVLVGLLASASLAQTDGGTEKPRILVLDITGQGVPADQAATITDAVVSTLTKRGLFETVSSRDVQTLVSAERQRQLLGACDESCSTELSTLLKARFVLSGQLGRLGSAYQLTLQSFDSQASKLVARATRLASSLEELRSIVPYAAAEATGSPLPPPPNRALPISLIAAGGTALAVAGVLAITIFTRQQLLNDELCPGGIPADGQCNGMALRERSFYLAQDQVLRDQKWLTLGVALAGAALLTVGITLNPPPDGAARFALLPTTNGLLAAGVF